MAGSVEFDRVFAPAEAERGKFVPIDTSTLTDYPVSGSRGRYALLSYIVGSEVGALNLALSGGNVILPVSSVNINEPLEVINQTDTSLNITTVLPDTTEYTTVTIAPTSRSEITFSSPVSLVEIFNNDTSNNVYLGFNDVTLASLSAQALPIKAESFYSIERTTSTLYLGNIDASTSLDVRVVGHYKS